MRTLGRTLQSASLSASVLAGNLVVLVLYLNPALGLARELPALFVSLFVPYLLAGTSVLFVLALAGGLLRYPFTPRPPLPSVPWFTTLAFLATAAAAALYWLNLWEYRHSIPVEFLRGLTAAAVAVTAAALVLLAVMADLPLLPRPRARAGGRDRGPRARARGGPAPGPASDPGRGPCARPRSGRSRCAPARRIILFGVDGLSLELLRDGLARGTQPVFARLLKRGAHGPLATLRPTEAPPLWTTILTGRLPRDHGIKSFATYRLRGSPSVYELLPTFAFVSRLERAGLVTTVPVTARDRKTKALWSHLAGFGVPSGFVRMWGSHPAEPSSGFVALELLPPPAPGPFPRRLQPPSPGPPARGHGPRGAARRGEPGDPARVRGRAGGRRPLSLAEGARGSGPGPRPHLRARGGRPAQGLRPALLRDLRVRPGGGGPRLPALCPAGPLRRRAPRGGAPLRARARPVPVPRRASGCSKRSGPSARTTSWWWSPPTAWSRCPCGGASSPPGSEAAPTRTPPTGSCSWSEGECGRGRS